MTSFWRKKVVFLVVQLFSYSVIQLFSCFWPLACFLVDGNFVCWGEAARSQWLGVWFLIPPAPFKGGGVLPRPARTPSQRGKGKIQQHTVFIFNKNRMLLKYK